VNKQRKPLPLPVVIVLIVLGAIVLAAGGYFALIGPKRSKAKEVALQVAAAQKQLDDFQAAKLAAQNVKPLEVADLFRLSKAMPDRADMAGVLLELNGVAADSGITFESISPQTSVPISGYQAMPIQLNFRGNFYDLADFLYRLRNLVGVQDGRLAASGRLFAVDTLDFTESTEGFPQIEAVLVVDAFVYGTGATATATPTTTTSTDTTATTTTPAPTAPPTDASAAGATG
jgi:hypothetical protein